VNEMTPQQIDEVFAKRREQQDAIGKEIDAALDSNDNVKLKESLDKLVSAYLQPIKFN
jgi:hypothetical protein